MRQLNVRKQKPSEIITGIADEQVKNLTNEILEDTSLSGEETKEQLRGVIDENDLNVNQTTKIQRIIDNLRPTGRSYGQSLKDADELLTME